VLNKAHALPCLPAGRQLPAKKLGGSTNLCGGSYTPKLLLTQKKSKTQNPKVKILSFEIWHLKF
jgi:hypothetical protein